MISSRRLTKELTELRNGSIPAGCALLKADDLETWLVSLSVGDSLYSGKTFCLRFKFTKSYPIDAPEVTFLTSNGYAAPTHPHIYSNGHICLSILSETSSSGWSPVLNVAAVCLTIQSMLASNTKLETPPDNARYVATAPSNPKHTKWAFHDDTV